MMVVSVTILAVAAPAQAQSVEYVAKVSVPLMVGTPRPIGTRYIALSSLLFDKEASLPVLDLDARKVIEVKTTRAMMLRNFGLANPLNEKTVPEGELVMYDGKRAGLFLSDDILASTRRQWYAELDAKTGALVRSTRLATLDNTAELYIVGTDPQRATVWFYVEHFGAPRGADGRRTAGPKDIVLRKLDLATLTATDVMTIPLAARPMRSGYEDQLTVRHADDFSRFAVVEYDERAFQTQPTAKVIVVDPSAATTFSVPALDTTYGVAFSRDGKYIYLASSQLGTVARVDLATKRIDKTAPGPLLTHDAIISPNGKQLFVIGSSARFSVYELPGLSNRGVLSHGPEVAPGAAQLSGSGIRSLDGTYYVLQDASPPGDSGTTTTVLVITRIVD
jgi:hypothetical protein